MNYCCPFPIVLLRAQPPTMEPAPTKANPEPRWKPGRQNRLLNKASSNPCCDRHASVMLRDRRGEAVSQFLTPSCQAGTDGHRQAISVGRPSVGDEHVVGDGLHLPAETVATGQRSVVSGAVATARSCPELSLVPGLVSLVPCPQTHRRGMRCTTYFKHRQLPILTMPRLRVNPPARPCSRLTAAMVSVEGPPGTCLRPARAWRSCS